MSESRNHMRLVNVALQYIKTIVPTNATFLIQVDSADSLRPTSVNGGFIPDVFFWNQDLLVIGEAKTINDFGRQHSVEQYQAYINECRSFYGQAILVISVPWQLVATAKNYFRRLKRDSLCESKIIIVNETGRSFEI